MTAAGEIMVPMSDAEVLQKVDLLVLRQIQDTLRQFGQSQEAMREDVQEIRERMIVIETVNTAARVASVEERLTKLEMKDAEFKGNVNAVTWLAVNWQTLTLAGIALAAGAKYVGLIH